MLYSLLSMVLYLLIYSLCPDSFFYSTPNFSNILLGQFLEAEEFYERAIAGAAENEFIQEKALAYELATKHYLARG
jgi:hypothetical protein